VQTIGQPIGDNDNEEKTGVEIECLIQSQNTAFPQSTKNTSLGFTRTRKTDSVWLVQSVYQITAKWNTKQVFVVRGNLDGTKSMQFIYQPSKPIDTAFHTWGTT
jgi:hypothetical protein